MKVAFGYLLNLDSWSKMARCMYRGHLIGHLVTGPDGYLRYHKNTG